MTGGRRQARPHRQRFGRFAALAAVAVLQQAFPFEGEYVAKTSPVEAERHVVKITGLPDPSRYDCNEMYGLMCEVREGRRKWQIPLVEVEVGGGGIGGQMLVDYGDWFSNHRFPWPQ